MLIADPRHLDRQFLVGQIHRAALTSPAHMSRQAPLAGIPGARQPLDVRLQFLHHLVESHGNQRLDQRHAGVDVRGRRHRRRRQADLLSFSPHLSYFARHGWCPPSELSCSGQEHPLLYGVATRISTNRSTHSLGVSGDSLTSTVEAASTARPPMLLRTRAPARSGSTSPAPLFGIHWSTSRTSGPERCRLRSLAFRLEMAGGASSLASTQARTTTTWPSSETSHGCSSVRLSISRASFASVAPSNRERS